MGKTLDCERPTSTAKSLFSLLLLTWPIFTRWTFAQDLELTHAQGHAGKPLCYSSPFANPSQGAWKKGQVGVDASPMEMSSKWPYWADQPSVSAYVSMCDDIWAEKHVGEGTRPYWKWEPRNCRLEEVTAARFCRVMQGRKGLLLVGDSLTHEFSITLASILRASLLSTTRFFTPNKWKACDGALDIHFYRSDDLNTRTEEHKFERCVYDGINFCITYANDKILREFDTLVVNAGAHLPEKGFSAYASMMEAASATLEASMRRLHGEDAILVVRNTPPGHGQCGQRMFGAPVDFDAAVRLVHDSPKQYGWATFDRRNEILENTFTGNSSNSSSWKLLDAYTPTLLRADSHRTPDDCLHYCLPGPIDLWVSLLYNILLAEKGD